MVYCLQSVLRGRVANVITESGKDVEPAGDIDTLLLDKTGTITIGNRKATNFYPVAGIDEREFIEACLMSSLSDETPEGKSIVELGRERGFRMRDLNTVGAKMIKFTRRDEMFGSRYDERYTDPERGIRCNPENS